MILALSAILVANMSAQEQKKEGKERKQFTKEERIDFDTKRLTNELMLSDQQAEKFAATYRDYRNEVDELFQRGEERKQFEPGKEITDKELDQFAKQRFARMKQFAALQEKYYDKFRKDLSARQVEKVMNIKDHCGKKACCDQKGHRHGEGEEKGGRKGEDQKPKAERHLRSK